MYAASVDTQQSTAALLSKLLGPYVILPCTTIAVALKASGGDLVEASRWSALVVGLVVIVPLLFVLSRVRAGKLADMHIHDREQRHGVYLAGVFWFGLCAASLAYVEAPVELIALVCSTLGANTIDLLINTTWKVSYHTTAIGGATAVALVLFGGVVVLVPVSLVPVLVWCRMRLGAHTFWQLIVGTASGGASAFLVFAAFGL